MGGAGGTTTTTGAGGTAISTGGTGGLAGLVKLCGTATADSEQNSTRGVHPATDGNDGNMATRWTAADAVLGHYWTLDMGCEQSPERVIIYWEYPNGNYGDPYGATLQISHDGQVFTDLLYVEQSGQIMSVDLTAAEGTGGADAGGVGGAGGAGGASGASGGTTGSTLDGGGASGGGPVDGGVDGGFFVDAGSAGGASGAGGAGGAGGGGGATASSPWDGKARYLRVVVTKVPLPVNGRATWVSFWELEVYTHMRNNCGVACR
jgi:hypothetical protein